MTYLYWGRGRTWDDSQKLTKALMPGCAYKFASQGGQVPTGKQEAHLNVVFKRNSVFKSCLKIMKHRVFEPLILRMERYWRAYGSILFRNLKWIIVDELVTIFEIYVSASQYNGKARITFLRRDRTKQERCHVIPQCLRSRILVISSCTRSKYL